MTIRSRFRFRHWESWGLCLPTPLQTGAKPKRHFESADGYLCLPTQRGWGADLNEQVLAQYPWPKEPGSLGVMEG